MFKVGDLAVYPGQGVGVIEALEKKQVNGVNKTFYVMKILQNDVKIIVPTEMAETIGMRVIISQDLVPRVYEIFKQKKTNLDNGGWNKRYREFSEKIKTGSIFEIAEVMRDLLLLKQKKGLSFREARMLEFVTNLVIKEISLATNKEEHAIEEKIKEFFFN
jgi:CarD family transcriptional regulator